MVEERRYRLVVGDRPIEFLTRKAMKHYIRRHKVYRNPFNVFIRHSVTGEFQQVRLRTNHQSEL